MTVSPPDRVCAVVVAYDCGSSVEPTLRSILPQVERIVVVDNGSREETGNFLRRFAEGEGAGRTEVLRLPQNRGIAAALNAGMGRAALLGYAWVLTMDHDSEAATGMVDAMVKAWREWPGRDRVLLLAPLYVDRISGAVGRVYRYERFRRVPTPPESPAGGGAPAFEATVLITSGNLVNVARCLAVGGFDESLFIDFVDHDFCLKGGAAGLSCLWVPGARLLHSVGKARTASILGHTFVLGTNHSTARRRTMARNAVLMVRRYGRALPRYAFDVAANLVRETLAMALFEEGRGEKGRAILAGLRDGFRENRP